MSDKHRISAASTKLRLLDAAGTHGVLMGTQCRSCARYFFGDVPACQACFSPYVEPVELGAGGSLFSYTIVRTPPPGWQGEVPYALGEVELPQGPHVISQIVGCSFDQIQVGMDLELDIAEVGKTDDEKELVIYKWRPASRVRQEGKH